MLTFTVSDKIMGFDPLNGGFFSTENELSQLTLFCETFLPLVKPHETHNHSNISDINEMNL